MSGQGSAKRQDGGEGQGAEAVGAGHDRVFLAWGGSLSGLRWSKGYAFESIVRTAVILLDGIW
jgi:hypothetical protein